MSIKIYFGPYEAHGTIRHKLQKLHGVLQRLTELKYEVELIPTNFLNIVTVTMKGREIYRCDIRNLLFNVDYEYDSVAQTFIAAVEEANSRLNADQNITNLPAGTNRRTGGNFEDDLSDDIHLLFVIPKTEKEAKVDK